MKLISIFLLIISTAIIPMPDFLADQKKFERVRTAFEEKEKTLTESLKDLGIEVNSLNILIVAYKAEAKLEIYAKKKSEINYKKLKSYDICASSGELGPKRKYGDSQVPEGFYHVNRFNPTSNFYLSLGLNYPNASDKKKSKATNLGGDIFIHGSCVTIGCMPMTDDKIMEIYLYAIHARNNGQLKIPVYVFPFKMTEQNLNGYKDKYKDNRVLIDFWTNLKSGYDQFESHKQELKISIDSKGNYIFG